MAMKVLLTGAGGLLGRCLARELAALTVVGAARRATPGLTLLDIADPDAVRQVVDAGKFTHILNCAALRSPEYCLDHPDEAYRINALAVEYLAAAANRTGATLVHVSTDYVFDGVKPPFTEDDRPNPVNLYGRTKLAGEFAAKTAKRVLITRIPALWRLDFADERNVAAAFAKRLRAGESWTEDAVTVRYYTLAEDIARAIRFLMEKGVEGTIHLTANGKTNKAEFAQEIAKRLGLDAALVRSGSALVTSDPRPLDSHLNEAKYRALGGPEFTPVDAAFRSKA